MEFTTERGFTRALDKAQLFNKSAALQEFGAWLARNNSKQHSKLFHSNGHAKSSAFFGAVALTCWGEFLTTKTKHPGLKRWCTVQSKFVWCSAEKKKTRDRNRVERKKRLDRLVNRRAVYKHRPESESDEDIIHDESESESESSTQ